MSPFCRMCHVVLLMYVFSCLKAETFLSHPHVVTVRPANISTSSVANNGAMYAFHAVFLDYECRLLGNCQMYKPILQLRGSLGVTFTASVKSSPDFNKSLETGQDRRLRLTAQILVRQMLVSIALF